MTSDATYPAPLRSAVPGIAFPALPGSQGTAALAFQWQLERTERLPAEALLALQLRQLSEVVRHAAATSPWWAQRLHAAGVDPTAPLTVEAFRRLPILDRDAVQQAGEALDASEVPKAHGGVGVTHTSGSTGKPVRVQKSQLQLFFWHAITLRDHLWHRRDLGAKSCVIRHVKEADAAAPPHGTRSSGWGPATDGAFATGELAVLSIRSDPAEQADWLRRERPRYLLTYPSALRDLLAEVERSGQPVEGIEQVRTVSEMLPPVLRERTRQVLGAEVIDLYSTQEVGYIALQCPDHPHYHVQSEVVFTEILRPDGSPCAPGEVGRVVVTPLHGLATPLLRYDVGDLAEVGAPCACGRGLPVLTRILGRVRHMIRFPDGRRSWPVFHDHRFRDVAPVRQYRIVQTHLDRLRMELVVERPLTADEEHALAEIVTKRVGWPFQVHFAYPHQLERGPGGKFEDFRCEVEDPP